MSRIGKRPIPVPKGAEVIYADKVFTVKGPKGTMTHNVPESVELEIGEGMINVVADYKNDKVARMMMGTTQAVVSAKVIGVTEGFTKKLNLVGVGYRATVNGKVLELNLGYSHPVAFQLPEGVKATMQGNTGIILESCDKQLLGQTAVEIRAYRKPEPYKGKGVLYDGEILRRKAGKSGKK